MFLILPKIALLCLKKAANTAFFYSLVLFIVFVISY
ncbi:uncharacterized protein METZ01_LOCUS149893 [marine metagenome]|uniref:Uncharacterized protein n=1 Tax=marine metagenome TaxID=408172 RepID=A0A382A6P1_9ZZZZ